MDDRLGAFVITGAVIGWTAFFMFFTFAIVGAANIVSNATIRRKHLIKTSWGRAVSSYKTASTSTSTPTVRPARNKLFLCLSLLTVWLVRDGFSAYSDAACNVAALLSYTLAVSICLTFVLLKRTEPQVDWRTHQAGFVNRLSLQQMDVCIISCTPFAAIRERQTLLTLSCFSVGTTLPSSRARAASSSSAVKPLPAA